VSRAVLALGSNLGDRVAALEAAVAALVAADVRVVAVSTVYETAPVGGPEQGDFLNAVALVGTGHSAYDLLEVVHGVEASLGRVRTQRWGPRTIDIDIITFGDVESTDPRLTLPHPFVAERAFVLAPWLDVEPDAQLPGGRSVASLLAVVGMNGVRRCEDIVLRLPA